MQLYSCELALKHIAFYGKPISKLQSVMDSRSPAVCDYIVLPARLSPERASRQSQPVRPVLHLPTTPIRWKAELTFVLAIYRYNLPVHRQSPIQVSDDSDATGN